MGEIGPTLPLPRFDATNLGRGGGTQNTLPRRNTLIMEEHQSNVRALCNKAYLRVTRAVSLPAGAERRASSAIGRRLAPHKYAVEDSMAF